MTRQWNLHILFKLFRIIPQIDSVYASTEKLTISFNTRLTVFHFLIIQITYINKGQRGCAMEGKFYTEERRIEVKK